MRGLLGTNTSTCIEVLGRSTALIARQVYKFVWKASVKTIGYLYMVGSYMNSRKVSESETAFFEFELHASPTTLWGVVHVLVMKVLKVSMMPISV